jgi:iron complex transport system substrate-binding protein
VRIVSLLPSLTELVCALGHEPDLVGVSHECDYPDSVGRLPRLTRSRIDPNASAGAIDRAVTDHGGSLYTVDREALAALQPDLILTQAQCDACAVSEASVRQLAAELPGAPRVESVNPTNLDGVFVMFHRVATLLGSAAIERAVAFGRRFQELVATIGFRALTGPASQAQRLIHLEWIDPPFRSGHWNPDLVALAGGVEPLARSGEPSRRMSWAEVAAAAPEVLLVAPCGFSLDRTQRDWQAFASSAAAAGLHALSPRVVLADGNAYFSRPGPRLLESLGVLAAAVHPERNGDLAPAHRWTHWDGWKPHTATT